MTDILEVKDLHTSIDGQEILKGVNLIVREGEIHALMGPNGTGKSDRWGLSVKTRSLYDAATSFPEKSP